jgi:hypothetical protein
MLKAKSTVKAQFTLNLVKVDKTDAKPPSKLYVQVCIPLYCCVSPHSSCAVPCDSYARSLSSLYSGNEVQRRRIKERRERMQ